MTQNPINLLEKISHIDELWTPKVISEMNDYQIKLVKVQGEFIWHSHKDTDETFFVIRGTLYIALRNRTIELQEGELFVIPKGVEHKPYAPQVCDIMLIEPKGVVNTGDEETFLTAKNDAWI